MATRTRVQAQLFDGSGHSAVLSYDYDDVTLNVSLIRCVNGFSGPVFVQLTRTSDGHIYGPFTCAANSTTTQNVPTTGLNRLGLTLRSDGKLDGAEVQLWS